MSLTIRLEQGISFFKRPLGYCAPHRTGNCQMRIDPHQHFLPHRDDEPRKHEAPSPDGGADEEQDAGSDEGDAENNLSDETGWKQSRQINEDKN